MEADTELDNLFFMIIALSIYTEYLDIIKIYLIKMLDIALPM